MKRRDMLGAIPGVPLVSEIATALRVVRWARHHSQRTAARLMGVSNSTLSRFEAGIGRCNADALVAVARYLEGA